MGYGLFPMVVTVGAGHTRQGYRTVSREDIFPSCVTHPLTPDVSSWNELEGVHSVDRTGEPMGWRTVASGEGVWQLRPGDDELVVSRGDAAADHTDWWVSVRRDGSTVVEDHRVRVGDDNELGKSLATVLMAVKHR